MYANDAVPRPFFGLKMPSAPGIQAGSWSESRPVPRFVDVPGFFATRAETTARMLQACMDVCTHAYMEYTYHVHTHKHGQCTDLATPAAASGNHITCRKHISIGVLSRWQQV